MALPISILDQSPVCSGTTPAQAIHATVELARAAERLGYARYWLAEHHAMAGLADSSPEVLLAHLAARTSRIRLGSGGVMLPHYSTYKVAENFRMLEALAPGRVDIGVGRAPGGTQLVNAALESGDPADFPRHIVDLIGWLRGRLAPEHPFASLAAMPSGTSAPQPWVLGSSDFGAMLAARLGLPFVYAHFIGGDGPNVTDLYRHAFRATELGGEPRVMLATAALAADTGERARELGECIAVWRAHLHRGRSIPVPNLEQAAAYAWSPGERHAVGGERRMALGTPVQVRDRLQSLANDHGADELMIVTIAPSAETRMRSYELVAGAFAQAVAATSA